MNIEIMNPEINEIVEKIIPQLSNIPNYGAVSIWDLANKARVDIGDYALSFKLQYQFIKAASKQGFIVDYDELENTDYGLPGGAPAVIYRKDAVNMCEFNWENCSFHNVEDVCSVSTKVGGREIQVRFYNGYRLISGRIYYLDPKQYHELFRLLDSCSRDWEKDDYSVPVCDGYRWKLEMNSNRKRIRTVSGTVQMPPHGEEIRKMIKKIVGAKNCYVF